MSLPVFLLAFRSQLFVFNTIYHAIYHHIYSPLDSTISCVIQCIILNTIEVKYAIYICK